jgi:hypothetical protein
VLVRGEERRGEERGERREERGERREERGERREERGERREERGEKIKMEGTRSYLICGYVARSTARETMCFDFEILDITIWSLAVPHKAALMWVSVCTDLEEEKEEEKNIK